MSEKKCKGCYMILPASFRAGRIWCSISCNMKYQRKSGCYTKEKMLLNRGPCSIEGCNDPVHAHGYCQRHANNLYRNGGPLIIMKKQKGNCKIPGCNQIHLARGFCQRHYRSWRDHGDPSQVDRNLEKEELRGRLKNQYPNEYKVWRSMRTRCYNKKCPQYKYYGAKGVRVYDQWA